MSWNLDSLSPSEIRSYVLQAAKYDLDVIAWWGIQCWSSEGCSVDNIWTYRYAHWNFAMLPGRKELGREMAVPTIRLKLIREGLDDAAYVKELRARIAEARGQGDGDAARRGETALDVFFSALVPTHNDYNAPYADILSQRRRLAAAIVALEGYGR